VGSPSRCSGAVPSISRVEAYWSRLEKRLVVVSAVAPGSPRRAGPVSVQSGASASASLRGGAQFDTGGEIGISRGV
jgi:hypothetical protein